MPLVQNVSTSTPDTMVGTLPEAVASSTIPTAAIMIVGISTASSRITWARRSCRFGTGLAADVVGHTVEIPDQADRGQAAKYVVRGIHLPPEESLSRRYLVVMVVVVPALAHREQGECEVVARVVVGGIAPAPPHVGERVDRVRGVPAHDLANEEAPHQAGQATERRERQGECEHRQRPVAVQPLQLGVLRKVLDAVEPGYLEVAAQDPAL